MLGGGSPVLSVIVRILSARYRLIMNPGEKWIVDHASSSIAHPNAKVGIAGGYRVALGIEPSDILEYGPDCNAVDDRGRASFLERFIHCEVYKALFSTMEQIAASAAAERASRTLPVRRVAYA